MVDSHGIRDQGRGRKNPLRCSPKITVRHRLRFRPRELSELLAVLTGRNLSIEI